MKEEIIILRETLRYYLVQIGASAVTVIRIADGKGLPLFDGQAGKSYKNANLTCTAAEFERAQDSEFKEWEEPLKQYDLTNAKHL